MTAPTLTRIDKILDALADLTDAALLDTEVEVLDGPRLGELPWKHLMLGITDSPDTPPYTTRYTRQEGLGAPRYVEAFEVRCGLVLADGNSSIPALRTELVTVLGLLDTALRGKHRVRGVWDHVGLGEAEMRWFPVPHEQGTTVAVFFSIEGESLL